MTEAGAWGKCIEVIELDDIVDDEAHRRGILPQESMDSETVPDPVIPVSVAAPEAPKNQQPPGDTTNRDRLKLITSRQCVVPGCIWKLRSLCPDLSYHRFPSRSLHARQKARWIAVIRTAREDPTWVPQPNHSICSRHFAECDRMSSGNRSLLAPLAVPTLKLTPDEPETEAEPEEEVDIESTSDIACFSTEIPMQSHSDVIGGRSVPSRFEGQVLSIGNLTSEALQSGLLGSKLTLAISAKLICARTHKKSVDPKLSLTATLISTKVGKSNTVIAPVEITFSDDFIFEEDK